VCQHCGSCATLLEVSLKYLASRTSHCEEVVALSAKIAKSCSDHCSQHQNPHCQDCAAACGKWAQDVHDLLDTTRT
jgi:hypothetical protein